MICPSEQNYSMLKEAAQQRIRSIVDYVSNGKECRSRQLVSYFGEQSETDCGVCDVCLRTSRRPSDVTSAVEQLLQKGPMGAQQLVQMLTSEGYEHVGDTVREMLDRGEVTLDGDFLLRFAF